MNSSQPLHNNPRELALGKFTFDMASGTEDYRGQTTAFAKPVSARYFRFNILSNHGSSEASGIAEIRFANADAKAAPHIRN